MSKAPISGFYRKSIAGRLDLLVEHGILDAGTAQRLRMPGGLLSVDVAERMVENVIGVFGLPFAVAPNFLVNGREHTAPMVIEEPSVVAGVSAAAALIRHGGGFEVSSAEALLIGQVHLTGVDVPDAVIAALGQHRDELLGLANATQPRLIARGGGATGLEYRSVRMPDGGNAVIVHLLVDTRDAMGANIVNTMCEGIARRIEDISGASARLKILSNLADRSLVTATARIPRRRLAGDGLDGEAVRDAIVTANELANADPYRAVTHNKGIMNGMDAVAIATGNDWRALEAGAHAYAVRDGAYRALTRWSAGPRGSLQGELRLPVRAGTVGGSLRSNPAAVAGLCIAGVESSRQLAELMAAVGLAQNLAALRALVTAGIQKGHMRLHARSVAAAAGVPDALFDEVVRAMIDSGEVKEWKAREVVSELARVEAAIHESKNVGTAAGKVILLGEHAAVYGKHVLALPLPAAITARIDEATAGVGLSIPAWHVDERFACDADPTSGAAAIVQRIRRGLGLGDVPCRIVVDANIPPGMGLGSSAALSVALIRAADRCFGLHMDDEAVNALAFECERLTHGTPSGIDNTIAVYGRSILYSKDDSGHFSVIESGEPPPVVIASSGVGSATRDQVAAVRRRYEADTSLYGEIFERMGDLSKAGAEALQGRDYARLGMLMNVCQGLLNALQVSTPLLEQMIDIARQNGAVGAKLTGAGGGGSIVALCPGSVDAVTAALSTAGFAVVETGAGT